MELGLSLGDASKTPFGFMEKTREDRTNKGSLAFSCMPLSIAPSPNPTQQLPSSASEDDEDDVEVEDDHEQKKHIDNNTIDHTTTRRRGRKREATSLKVIHGDRLILSSNSSIDPPPPPPLQLDLLPNTPVPRHHRHHHHHHLLSLSCPSHIENCEVSERMRRGGFDVNTLPPAVEDISIIAGDQDGAAVSSSPPNSATSSFQHQMDFSSLYSSKSGGVNEFTDIHHQDQGERGCSSSRGMNSDEDDNNGSSRKKLRLSKEQSAFLEYSFKEHATLNPKQKLALAKQLNLRPRQVEVWFQNRRARTKLKQTEVDCDYLKRCCETLREENKRLQKEVQELRALKSSNPFYMQLPATTLTMCPSCERVATTSTTTAAANHDNNINNSSTEPAAATSGLSHSKPRFYPFSHSSPPNHHPTTTS